MASFAGLKSAAGTAATVCTPFPTDSHALPVFPNVNIAISSGVTLSILLGTLAPDYTASAASSCCWSINNVVVFLTPTKQMLGYYHSVPRLKEFVGLKASFV
jgi:hypothetical protein